LQFVATVLSEYYVVIVLLFGCVLQFVITYLAFIHYFVTTNYTLIGINQRKI